MVAEESSVGVRREGDGRQLFPDVVWQGGVQARQGLLQTGRQVQGTRPRMPRVG